MAGLTAPGLACAAHTLATYEREAVRYDAARSRSLFEEAWLNRLTEGLPLGAPVLDVGCGAGEPIGRALLGVGYSLTGVDGAPAMLAMARARLPSARFVCADMRTLSLGTQFAAVLAWNSLFHLTGQDQRLALPRLMAHVAPGGRLLITVGPSAGTRIGRVGHSPVFHESLSLSAYAALVEAGGLTIRRFVAEDPDCGLHSVLLAERPPERSG